MLNPEFYDRAYFDGTTKSNYGRYGTESSPFGLHADAIENCLAHYELSGPVLDVGCATGYLVAELCRRGIDAWGVDWSAYAVSNAVPGAAATVRCASGTSLPFGDRRFALAVTFDVFEHLDRETAELVLKECARVSERQLHQINTGRLAEWRYDGDASHCLKLALADWRAMADQVGVAGADICEPDRDIPCLAVKPVGFRH